MSRRRSRSSSEPYWVHSDPDGGPPAGVAYVGVDVAQVASDAAEAEHRAPCPGACNRAWRYPASIDPDGTHLDAEGRVLVAVPGAPYWCRPCGARLLADLRRLPDLAAGVRQRPDGRLLAGTDAGDRTRRRSGDSAPSLSPALDVVDELASWAEARAAELADDVGLTIPRVQGTAARVRHLTDSVGWLVQHGSALLAHEVLSAMVAFEVQGKKGWVAQLERASGQDRLRHRLDAPCPACDLRALVRDDGSDQVDCRACRNRWPEADYQRLVRILADDLRREAAEARRAR